MSNPAFTFDHVHIISEDPHKSAAWYVEMLGATIRADTVARGADLCRTRRHDDPDPRQTARRRPGGDPPDPAVC